MFRYIGKDPETGQVQQQSFRTPQEANQHGIKNIDKYPNYRIIFVADQEKVVVTHAAEAHNVNALSSPSLD